MNRFLRQRPLLSTLAALSGVFAALCVACPASLDDRCAAGACTRSALDGSDVLDGGPDAPPTDPCVETPSDPKCLDESSALFVSAAADPGKADGTRAAPFATIGAALGKVSADKKRVYVCDGDYPETVTITTQVALIGGLSCTWQDKSQTKPLIKPANGVAVSVLKAGGVALTDLRVEASADNQKNGDSAIAIFASEAQNLLLLRVDAKAGSGVQGHNGANGVDSPNFANPIATNGNSTGSATGAPAPTCGACNDGSSSAGGYGADAGATAGPGSAMPAVGTANSGSSNVTTCTGGTDGANGVAGAAAAGATAPGKASATGWDPAHADVLAKNGSTGNPGQGGGGGGSTTSPAIGGGSGGCGGCGGTGGKAAGNGGSSFAILSFNSGISVRSSTLAAADGAAGGRGGDGQLGQERGSLGGGTCNGGNGGYGAGGGGGGGGAGGHSAAIAHVGTAPEVVETTLTKGKAGGAGSGGDPGPSSGNAGAPGSPGAPGQPKEVLLLE